uniref:Uncharacterized protein n=1 Tax=Glycine max TaxID=3847 RepID=C6T356_SOYBN|nr:unknown [Glycine max]
MCYWKDHADFDGTRKENFPSKESIGPELGHEEILYNRWPREALMLYLSCQREKQAVVTLQFVPRAFPSFACSGEVGFSALFFLVCL